VWGVGNCASELGGVYKKTQNCNTDLRVAPPDIRDANTDLRVALPDIRDANTDLRVAPPDIRDANTDLRVAPPDVENRCFAHRFCRFRRFSSTPNLRNLRTNPAPFPAFLLSEGTADLVHEIHETHKKPALKLTVILCGWIPFCVFRVFRGHHPIQSAVP
jgi:hypothetical protein